MASLKFVISRCPFATRTSKFPFWPPARPVNLSGSDGIWPLLVNPDIDSVSSEIGSSGTGRFTFLLNLSQQPGHRQVRLLDAPASPISRHELQPRPPQEQTASGRRVGIARV